MMKVKRKFWSKEGLKLKSKLKEMILGIFTILIGLYGSFAYDDIKTRSVCIFILIIGLGWLLNFILSNKKTIK